MKLQIDESRMLYGLGAFLGVLTILYFGQQLILDLSPAIKSFILLSSTVSFLAAAEYVRPGVLRTAFYIFSGFAYLSFLLYIFTRFSFTSEQTFLVLAVSSASFIVLGYLKGQRDLQMDDELAWKMVAVMVSLVAVAILFDVTGSQPDYSLELEDSVEVIEGREIVFGQMIVENDFILSRNLESVSYTGCLFREGENERGVFLGPDMPRLIGGGETLRFNLTDTFRSRPDENTTLNGNYSVARGRCPIDPEPNTIYIRESDGREILRSVD